MFSLYQSADHHLVSDVNVRIMFRVYYQQESRARVTKKKMHHRVLKNRTPPP